MRIACAFDHAGFPLKPIIIETLEAAGHEVVDLGTDSTDPVDYPDKARDAAEAVRGRPRGAGGDRLRLRARASRSRRASSPGSGPARRTTPTPRTSPSSTTTSTSSASARG